MQIEYDCDSKPPLIISHVCPGTPVEFLAPFHQDCRPTDIFIRVNIICGYMPAKQQYHDKIGVVNLRNGKLSYLDGNRTCRLVGAKIRVVT